MGYDTSDSIASVEDTTRALAFILNTYREHERTRLTSKAIQERMNAKFDPRLHNAIWKRLIELMV